MLKRIIKRDGQTEEFIPSKLNKWAIWSVGNLDSVDWPTVVLRTIKGCPEEISSQDLQKKLINTCVYENDWDHNLMAGRLYAAMMRKQIYGEQIPTVKELHEKLHSLGLMSKLSFTDEEYAEIEKIINHDRDFTYAYFQVSYMLGKYSIQNRVTGIKYEMPQFIAMRCAMGLSEEETGDKVENVRKHYEYISRGIINLPTPGFNNLGTDHHGYASCCLYSVKDTLDSLASGDHIAYIMTAMSAGIGNNIMTRSLGDTVRNGAIEHNGKLPYYKALAGSVMANKQGSRGGACTTYYSAYDPEASVITMLQNPRSPKERQNRDLHFAIIVNTHFAKAVIKNTDLFSFTVKSAPDLHEAMYSGDDELFESLYNKYENDETFEKVYFSPRKLIISASQQALETGTLYFFNASEVNKHTPFKDPIYSSNLCVAPETLILTKEFGYVEISTLKDKEVSVWNTEEWSKTTIRQTGSNERLFKVVVNNGSVLYTTPYHRWAIQNSYNKKDITIKTTAELLPGDMIVKHEFAACDHGNLELDFAYENGFYTADGTQLTKGYSRIYLYADKKNLLNVIRRDETYSKTRIGSCGRIEIDYEPDVLKGKFFVPGTEYTVRSRIEWLSGLYDGDGCVTNNQGARSLQLVSINYDFLVKLMLLLQELGVNSSIKNAISAGYRNMPDGKGSMREYYCKDSFKILITNEEIIKLVDLGFKPNRLYLDGLRSGNREARNFFKVTEVIDDGRVDDTYCFTEPKKNMGIFNGIATMNCLEITEPTLPYSSVKDLYSTTEERVGEVALCNLSAINVARNLTDEEYEDAMYYALKMIDVTIHKTEYRLPHVGVTAKARMNAGVGIIGLAYYLANKGLDYTSPLGLKEIHKVAERHMYFAIKASLRLGKELGNAPWINRTKWPDGWLPIDTYNKRVDELVEPVYQYDWESLRKEIIANGGIRNSTLIAHMPTESSSKAAGVPNGVYPIRGLYLKKTDGSNVSDWVANESNVLASQYQFAYDIDPVELNKAYAVLQKFCDQAISADSYYDRSVNPEVKTDKLLAHFLSMIKYGVKTRYYTNSLTTERDSGQVRSIGCEGGACTL